jgi:hypothetical protein
VLVLLSLLAALRWLDAVVVLPVELDVPLVDSGGCTGQRHLGIKGQAGPLHRSLRRCAAQQLCPASSAQLPCYTALVCTTQEAQRMQAAG